MEKNKIIHLRVSDAFYEKMTELASDCDDSLSNVTRSMIEVGINGFDDGFMERYPLHFPEFTLLILWIYSRKEPIEGSANNNSLELIRFYRKTLEEKIDLLDPHIQELFLNVKKDLDRIVYESDENSKIITRFGSKSSDNYFDYDLFERFLMYKSM